MSDNDNNVVSTICSPALVYLCFSLIQIVIDIYKKQFNTAFFKFWVMLVITTLLNILCERGLSIVSWLIVFVPIILMSVIIVILIYFLGFKPGQANKIFNVKQKPNLNQQMAINQIYSQRQNNNMDKINNLNTLDNTKQNGLPDTTTKMEASNTTQTKVKTNDLTPESFF